MFYSSSTGGFYDPALHGDAIPPDAVQITRRQHRNLLEAQARGERIEADGRGRPFTRAPHELLIADRHALAVGQIKAEAARRIETVAPAWRQANDNAALALAAIDRTAPDPAVRARREAIDGVRAASDALERAALAMTHAELDAFDPADDGHWPAPPGE